MLWLNVGCATPIGYNLLIDYLRRFKVPGNSTGGAEYQRKFWMLLPKLWQKEHPKEVPCHLCGRMILVEHVIVRDDNILCEECFDRIYGKKTPSKNASDDSAQRE